VVESTWLGGEDLGFESCVHHLYVILIFMDMFDHNEYKFLHV